ncbi:MAG: 2-phospho-L-lactate transferase [Anaerolineales bacterium]|nr:2-phospho-L-lactate transferase [Anaerolineales bacterium]
MNVVALAGGVGGAKLVDGLGRVLSPQELTVIVNTGDDFQLFGLHLSPDLDTVCYTLAERANPETGWGRKDESWHCLAELEKLQAPTWFKLGDRDLAVHLERTRRLEQGQSLSAITRDFCANWGIGPEVIPMSDDPVATRVFTDQGVLAFQEYFVREGCQPEVKGFEFAGSGEALPAPGVMESLGEADLVIICPSNPWVSIDPILSVGTIREGLRDLPVVAVTPLIAGQALKGPAAKMYREMGITPSARAVAEHYRDLLTGFVLDSRDQDLEDQIGSLTPRKPGVLVTDTWMKNIEDRVRLARETLTFGEGLT